MKGIIAILATAVAVLLIIIAAVLIMNTDEGGDKPIVDDKVVIDDGVVFYPSKGTLESDRTIQFRIMDELVQFVDKKYDSYECSHLKLDPGIYTMEYGNGKYHLLSKGSRELSIEWETYMDGEMRNAKVTYSIDMSELDSVMKNSGDWNLVKESQGNRSFSELKVMIKTDGSIKAFESKLKKEFIAIGGSQNDKQGYADFIASFAQMGIKYPDYYERGFDYQVWGCNDYWANVLETLFFKIGDCEDSSALACSLFMAAGYNAAMIGVEGHVAASVAIDGYKTPDIEGYKKFNSGLAFFKEKSSEAIDGKRGILYHGFDTTKGIGPVGFMPESVIGMLGKDTRFGISGFYECG